MSSFSSKLSGSGIVLALKSDMLTVINHSAGSSAPTSPTAGELWWDTSDRLLKVYDGSISAWRALNFRYVTPVTLVLDLDGLDTSGSWVSLDLTSVTSSKAQIALLHIRLEGGRANTLYLRPSYGTIAWIKFPGAYKTGGFGFFPLSSGQGLEYSTDGSATVTLAGKVYCVGYFE